MYKLLGTIQNLYLKHDLIVNQIYIKKSKTIKDTVISFLTIKSWYENIQLIISYQCSRKKKIDL